MLTRLVLLGPDPAFDTTNHNTLIDWEKVGLYQTKINNKLGKKIRRETPQGTVLWPLMIPLPQIILIHCLPYVSPFSEN